MTPDCGSTFIGMHREPGKRGRATRGPLCPYSYTEQDGFRLCRGLRMRGRCPLGLGAGNEVLEAPAPMPMEVE